MPLVDPTNTEASEVQQTDIEAAETEVEGPRGRDRLIWLAAAIVFAAGGVIWVVNSSDPPVVAVIFVAVALGCMAMAAGFTRRK